MYQKGVYTYNYPFEGTDSARICISGIGSSVAWCGVLWCGRMRWTKQPCGKRLAAGKAPQRCSNLTQGSPPLTVPQAKITPPA